MPQDKDTWDHVVKTHGSEFLQSYNWGLFQTALGKRVERIGGDDFLAQIIFQSLPFGLEYGYIPRGPVVIREPVRKNEFWHEFDRVRLGNTIFFEFDLARPISFLSPTNPTARQPIETTIVDLKKSAEEIFSGFHRTLRYSIRLSERKGVLVRKDSDWQGFFYLYKKTAQHHHIRTWPESYFKTLWQTLGAKGEAEVWSAYQDNKLLVSNFYILFGKRVTYLFGGSDYQQRSLMAPHLLHWQVMQSFKERGFWEYDLGGIDKIRWPGVTTFKTRFGGKIISYPGTYIKVERENWYQLYRIAKKWR